MGTETIAAEKTAKDRWGQLDPKRDGVLSRARKASEITIPSLLPPLGADENTKLKDNYQSLGARGVNNLASKLLMALLPPNMAFFRLTLADQIKEDYSPEQLQEVEDYLRKIENAAMRQVEGSNIRKMLFNYFRHLIVAGNALLFMPDDQAVRMYRISSYCTVRNPMGDVMEIVIKEQVHKSSLDEATRSICQVDANSDGNEQDVDVYTWVTTEDKKYIYHQEINDIRVPGSDGSSKLNESPFIVGRWTAVENEDYGRSMVEEHMGDLLSLEGLSKAIVDFSALAARILFLLDPNSTLDEDDLEQAENGAVVLGRAEDIGILQMDKFADFRVTKETLDNIEMRVSQAFLLQSGTTRDAERVTAEEIRNQARELEDVLGGTYTVQAHETQLPIVSRLLVSSRKKGLFPKNLPKVAGQDAITPTIVTGFEALGRGHELSKFREFYSDLIAMVGEEQVFQVMNSDALIKRLALGHNVDIEGLVKSPEDRKAEQEAQQAQQMIQQATPAMAQAAGKMVTEQ